MAVVVDGYNLVFAVADFAERQFSQAVEEARREVLARLASLHRHSGERVTVVFDRRRPTGEAWHSERVGGVRVVFSRPPRTADDEIRALVSRSTAPRHILVVTSDRQLAGDCRRLGARVAGAKTFFSRLVRLTDRLEAEEAEHREKTRRPSAAEVAEWLKIFGERKEG